MAAIAIIRNLGTLVFSFLSNDLDEIGFIDQQEHAEFKNYKCGSVLLFPRTDNKGNSFVQLLTVDRNDLTSTLPQLKRQR